MPPGSRPWNEMEYYVIETLDKIAECQESQTRSIAEMREATTNKIDAVNSDVRLLKFQAFLIGLVASSVVTALVNYFMRK
jgi:hypothetical protein